MPSLNEFRADLNPFQLELLDEIVAKFLNTGKGPATRTLHLQHDKDTVIAALRAIGGSAVFEVEDHINGHRYEPKLLGMLLSSRGAVYQELLARYASFVEEMVRTQSNRTAIESSEVTTSLSLSSDESRLLYKLLLAGYLIGSGGHNSPDGSWSAGIFEEVDQLRRWPNRMDFAEYVALRHYDPNASVMQADRQGYSITHPGLSSSAAPDLPKSPPVGMDFDYEPDSEKLIGLVGELNSKANAPFRMVRHFRNSRLKEGIIVGDALRKELPELDKLELVFFYKPGNPDLGGWASFELEFTEKIARVRCLGDYDWFRRRLNACIERLSLRKSASSQLAEFVQKTESSISPTLWSHIKGSLRDGNHAAALSAAVVFIEDRLRAKINVQGNQMTGAELVLHAYRSPGVLTPPLGLAGNAEENAHLLMRGWFGLVRNLHGHQVSFEISHDEAFAQLSGANYILWIIENSSPKRSP